MKVVELSIFLYDGNDCPTDRTANYWRKSLNFVIFLYNQEFN